MVFKNLKLNIFLLLIIGGIHIHAQEKYTYTIDLTNVVEDMVKVELTTPKIKQSEIAFYLPKITPGNYSIEDYGRFVHEFKAFDKKGRLLKTEKLDDNSWRIYDTKKLKKITYWVEDTYDSELGEPYVFEPSGTNFENDKNFVLNASGLFGYFDEMKFNECELNVIRDKDMYGATGLIAGNIDSRSNEIVLSEEQQEKVDTYRTENYYDLVDSPIMYTKPADTTILKIADTEVLIASYSPNNIISSKEIGATIKEILLAQKEYLGGELPVDKYAFLFYFSEKPGLATSSGALEHSYSSVYFKIEQPISEIKQWLRDVAAHEFFHIVTPLNIHSEEIHNFNYNEPNMSKHLWLYEGVTEYFSDNVQVQDGIISRDQYLRVLKSKMRDASFNYRNDLSFTELSRSILDNQSEFGNVYRKGALIGMCLDIKLRALSGGNYGMQNLVKDLSKKFGKNHPFKDDEFFDHITAITYPEIGEFLNKYVDQNNSLPYKEIYNLVGIEYIPELTTKNISFPIDSESVGYSPEKDKFFIANTDGLDLFGKAFGMQEGDVLLEIAGRTVPDATEIEKFVREIRAKMKAGEDFSIKVLREDSSGIENEVILISQIFPIEYQVYHLIKFDDEATEKQIKIREAWLSTKQ